MSNQPATAPDESEIRGILEAWARHTRTGAQDQVLGTSIPMPSSTTCSHR